MLAHLQRHHPSVSMRESGKKEQLLLPVALKQSLSEKSDRAKAMMIALGEFLAKDLQPYVVVDDVGFQH